ncbi:hypothetical protein PVAP13_5KG459207 [Panicum virgatum]|uniref:Uncharacterized protein n=1 Tax=Panicum virgatum TaxID=38727 RepID=A0A8T0SSA8_PANVG|nr:hypothetical protein PVAP13_5KG459207 [Panicum virgatum]
MHAPASRYVCTASGAPALSAAGARPGSDRPGPEPGIEDSMAPSGQAIQHGYMHGLPGSSPPHPGPYPAVSYSSLSSLAPSPLLPPLHMPFTALGRAQAKPAARAIEMRDDE